VSLRSLALGSLILCVAASARAQEETGEEQSAGQPDAITAAERQVMTLRVGLEQRRSELAEARSKLLALEAQLELARLCAALAAAADQAATGTTTPATPAACAGELRDVAVDDLQAEVADAREDVTSREQAIVDARLALELAMQQQVANSAPLPENACGSTENGSACLALGLFVATGSAASFSNSNTFAGQTSQQLVSLAIPYVALRWATGDVLSLELGMLTSVFGKDVSLSGDGSSSACRKDAVTFERKLPCEGDAHLRPYGALFAGPSIANEDINYFSIYGVLGAARTEKDPTPGFFVGVMFGVLGVQKTIAL